MEKYITDERTGWKYELVGDYYLLAGTRFEDADPEEDGNAAQDVATTPKTNDALASERPAIGRFGRAHAAYLKCTQRYVYCNQYVPVVVFVSGQITVIVIRRNFFIDSHAKGCNKALNPLCSRNIRSIASRLQICGAAKSSRERSFICLSSIHNQRDDRNNQTYTQNQTQNTFSHFTASFRFFIGNSTSRFD